jgi:hypothetical protein
LKSGGVSFGELLVDLSQSAGVNNANDRQSLIKSSHYIKEGPLAFKMPMPGFQRYSKIISKNLNTGKTTGSKSFPVRDCLTSVCSGAHVSIGCMILQPL